MFLIFITTGQFHILGEEIGQILEDFTYQSNTCLLMLSPPVFNSRMRFWASYVVALVGPSVFVLSVMPVCPSDYYSLRQRTV